jgi:hypothetical protein
VFSENPTRELFDFTKCDGLEAACALKAKRKSADARKQI